MYSPVVVWFDRMVLNASVAVSWPSYTAYNSVSGRSAPAASATTPATPTVTAATTSDAIPRLTSDFMTAPSLVVVSRIASAATGQRLFDSVLLVGGQRRAQNRAAVAAELVGDDIGIDRADEGEDRRVARL